MNGGALRRCARPHEADGAAQSGIAVDDAEERRSETRASLYSLRLNRGLSHSDSPRTFIGLGLLRAAERFRRIKRHGELGVLVTALGAVKATERAA